MAPYLFNTQALVALLKKNDATMVGIFGSEARGEMTEKSDIDILVRFATGKSLLALVRIEREASSLLGRRVDLLTEDAVSPYLIEGIKKDLQVIYEA